MKTTRSARPVQIGALVLIGSLAACAPGGAPTASPPPATVTSSAPAPPTPGETPTIEAPTSPAPGPTVAPTDSPTIVIDSPAADARVTVPVAASGTANTFEAALTLQLLTDVGDTLCVRNLMASSGSGVTGTWQSNLAFVPPDGDLPATLRAYELSATDGSPINVVERRVTVTPERPPIIIATPVCGDVVAPGGVIAVTGRALVFEAQFSLDLRDASGLAVLTQEVTADSGSEESNFTATLTVPADLPGGYYDLVGYDISAADGSIQHEFPVQILVQ